MLKTRLKELRKEARMNQQEVADAVNVNQRVISHWENGRNMPDLVKLNILADFFNVSTDYLLGRTDDRTPPEPIPEPVPEPITLAAHETDGTDGVSRERMEQIIIEAYNALMDYRKKNQS